MRTHFLVLLAAFWVGCATTPATSPEPVAKPEPRPLSPEAAAVFAHAGQPGPGGAIVVDLDALEALGLLGKGDAMRQLAGAVASGLPELATLEGLEGKESALLARSAVAASVLREWADWPSVQRVGLFLLGLDNVLGDEEQRGDLSRDVVMALAVREGSPDNARLLVGLAALGRAVSTELSKEGFEARMMMMGADLCVQTRELEEPFCIHPERGLLLLGTPSAIARMGPIASGKGSAGGDAEAADSSEPLLFGVRVDMGPQGRGRLALTGRDAVLLTVRVEGTQPRMVASLDSMVKKLVEEYDAREEKKRARIAAALDEVREALAKNPEAPVELKQTASTLTVEQVVDEKGYGAKLRESLQTMATQDTYTLHLTVPEALVEETAEQLGGGGLVMVGTVGVLAAVAIPNFVKYQARAKQSEVKANLKAAFIGQRAHLMEKDRWGRTFRDIGFEPESGRRYTYCMGSECLPCDHEAECQVPPEPSPCQGIARVGSSDDEGFVICAYGNVDSDEDWDVWVIEPDGQP
ncbi:MAG TPA: hypothetical protein VLQ93_24065, partial [Myxococcaceae bacterium]|nr:hypothetical protein [Myxococcaceae bacterium]